MLRLSVKAFFKIVTRRNPYVIAKNAGKTVISPE
jgi:hypothetical protein